MFSAIRGYNVDVLRPSDTTVASRFNKISDVRHVIFTAETHNFPTGCNSTDILCMCNSLIFWSEGLQICKYSWYWNCCITTFVSILFHTADTKFYLRKLLSFIVTIWFVWLALCERILCDGLYILKLYHINRNFCIDRYCSYFLFVPWRSGTVSWSDHWYWWTNTWRPGNRSWCTRHCRVSWLLLWQSSHSKWFHNFLFTFYMTSIFSSARGLHILTFRAADFVLRF